jgi:hypothetical protein
MLLWHSSFRVSKSGNSFVSTRSIDSRNWFSFALACEICKVKICNSYHCLPFRVASWFLLRVQLDDKMKKGMKTFLSVEQKFWTSWIQIVRHVSRTWNLIHTDDCSSVDE